LAACVRGLQGIAGQLACRRLWRKGKGPGNTKQREFLAQRVVLEVLWHVHAAHVRVPVKCDAEHVVALTFVPVGGRENAGNGRRRHGIFLNPDRDTDAFTTLDVHQIVEHLVALFFRKAVDATEIRQVAEPLFLTQEATDFHDGLPVNENRVFACVDHQVTNALVEVGLEGIHDVRHLRRCLRMRIVGDGCFRLLRNEIER